MIKESALETEEKKEKYIIAGGSVVCRTPPFKYLSEDSKEEIERRFPRNEERKKFYVISTKAFGEGDIIKVFPCVNLSSRKKVKEYCEEKSKLKEYCYFTKVIKTVNGYVEKFWIEEYYLEKIQQCNKRKRRRLKSKKNRKSIYYNRPSILIEKQNLKHPIWLEKVVESGKMLLNLEGETKIVSYNKNMVVIKAEKILNNDTSHSYLPNRKYLPPKMPYTNTVGMLRLRKDIVDNKKWEFFVQDKHRARLEKLTNSKVFKYFKVHSSFFDKETGEIILAITQRNDMPKESLGIPMSIYLTLIRKHLMIPSNVSREYNANKWTTHLKNVYYEY